MRSSITYKGLPEVPEFAGSLNYVYGISDFWMYIFQDKDLYDRVMEAQTYQLADMYSTFLQLCSTISLNDIRATFHSQLKLVLINETDLIPTEPGSKNISYKYLLPEKFLNAKYLIDRPVLPKYTYEEDVHYRISGDGDHIELYKPISELMFPTRNVVIDGVEVKQYAMWVTDVEIDEGALFNYFGKFVLPVTPGTSTELYKSYIQGVYFLYANGPTIDLLKRGLDLSIGLPFAREDESVIDVQQDPETGNYAVITANNSYTIPYGIQPDYGYGHALYAGTEVVSVTDLWDYKTPGKEEWWINVAIPRNLIPTWPSNMSTVAASGGAIDYYMRNYLKTHTFYVRIRSTNSFSADSMTKIIDLIDRAKPTYTVPIFVWAIPLNEEQLNPEDETFVMLPTLTIGEMMMLGEYIRRDNLDPDGNRCGVWIHSNGNLDAYAGVRVNATHAGVLIDPLSSTTTTVTDDQMTPLYNIPKEELVLKIQSLGPPYDTLTALPNKFLLQNLDATDLAIYNALVIRHPAPVATGIGYNCGDVDPFFHEITRRYVPDIADMSATETFMFVRIAVGVYSVFFVRVDQSLFLADNPTFTHVYFPPQVTETLEVICTPAAYPPYNSYPN